MNNLDKLYEFIMKTCIEYSIDESHGLSHSIDVYRFTEQIYLNELIKNPDLESRYEIIIYSAILHDMCDYKYMEEQIGIKI